MTVKDDIFSKITMITPRFTLNQDENTVTITIRAPYCDLSDLDIVIDEEIFIFACKPYYLRLCLPGRLSETNAKNKSCFDSDTGEFCFTYAKAIPGENFKDLELITKFVCTKVEVCEDGRKIEVLSTENGVNDGDFEGDREKKFGFAMCGKSSFCKVTDEFKEVFEIDPKEAALDDRKKVRMRVESEKFDADHYLSDIIDDDEICEIVRLKCPWESVDEIFKFTEKELDFLKDLPNRTYNLSPAQVSYCFNGLIDILFAYCYDRRTTYFEGTCESGWTISKLSATLSCFDGFTNPKEAIISGFRRSLIFPLYRNFALSQKVFDDLKKLLKLDEKFIIRRLIEIYEIFLGSERYILNDLYVKDYIVYAMKWDRSLWREAVEALGGVEVGKKDLGLDLCNVERSLGGDDDVCEKMQNLGIANDDSSSCDSDDDSSDTLVSTSTSGESSD